MRRDLTVAGHGLRESITPQGLAVLDQQPKSFVEAVDEEGLRWDRYFAAVWRFKYLILLIFALGSAAGWKISHAVKPEYTAQAQVYVARVASPDDAVGPVRSEGAMTAIGWMGLPKSLAILDGVVHKLKLYLEPTVPADSIIFSSLSVTDEVVTGKFLLETDANGRRFRIHQLTKEIVDSGAVGDSIGLKFNFKWAPTELPQNLRVEFSIVSPRDIAAELIRKLVVVLPEQASILTISLSGGDPDKITRTVNGVLTEFVDFATQMAKRNQTQIRETLRDQLAQANAAFDSAETAQIRYQIDIAKEPTDRQSANSSAPSSTEPIWTNYFSLTEQRANLTRDSATFHGLLLEAEKDPLRVQAFRTIEPVRQGTAGLLEQIDKLSVEQTKLSEFEVSMMPAATQVQKQRELVEKTHATLLAAGRNLLQTMGGQGRSLDARIIRAESSLVGIPERTIRTARLRNDVEIRGTIRAQLESDYARAKMAEGSAIPDVSIMRQAYKPVNPSAAPQGRIFGMIVLVSLAVSIALALLMDRLDTRVRYRDQITDDMGLLIIGAVPHTRHITDWRQNPTSAAATVEAFRSMRLALSQAFPPGHPVTVTITSPGQGEGKSLVSSNLALAFAEGGYRTLLIDGDTRRGELHRDFGVERRGGLLDFLAGRSQLSDVVRDTSTNNLWIIPAGTRFKRGPELLMSPALHPLLAELRTKFDAIVIDTPPLSAGVDAMVLGSTVGHMVLVLRHGRTDRRATEARLDLIDRLPIRVIGAVLNDMKGGYGYQQYAYVDGYEAEDEKEGELLHPSLTESTGSGFFKP